jgi:DNA-binding NtrC family response regulator
MPTLLIVDDEEVLARNLAKAFASRGFDPVHAASLAVARARVAEVRPDVVLLDLRLPDGSGLDLLDELLGSDPDLPVLMMTGHASVPEAVRAMKRGARDYVQKPLDLDEIRLKVAGALSAARERREISYHRERAATAQAILGESDVTGRLRALVERIARATAPPGGAAPTVLLLGETGSGKGHLARTLHASGGRSAGPFIEINCTALPENLVEAELFGHEKGAFTDAKAARAGLFEAADGGTIFLDEIGHTSPALQAKFLKVLEDRLVRRIGATAARKVDVQVIAATNRDLDAAVRLGEFRADLYQRLSVATLRVPPLREREGDAVRLAAHFLDETARRYGLAPRRLSPGAEAVVARYPWPGNVREVANAMERVVLFTDSDPVEAADLQLGHLPTEAGGIAAGEGGELRIDFPEGGLSLEKVERRLIELALERSGGNQSAAARLLGISRDTLRYRLEKFGLAEATRAD